MVEFFAGKKELSKAFARKNLRVCSYEILDNPVLFDWLSAPGYTHALRIILSMPPGSFIMAAPVCSSWARLYSTCTRRQPVDVISVCRHVLPHVSLADGGIQGRNLAGVDFTRDDPQIAGLPDGRSQRSHRPRGS